MSNGEVDPEVQQLLDNERRAAEVAAERNYRIMDNHLMHADRVIGNIAAMRLAQDNPLQELAEVLKTNPT